MCNNDSGIFIRLSFSHIFGYAPREGGQSSYGGPNFLNLSYESHQAPPPSKSDEVSNVDVSPRREDVVVKVFLGRLCQWRIPRLLCSNHLFLVIAHWELGMDPSIIQQYACVCSHLMSFLLSTHRGHIRS